MMAQQKTNRWFRAVIAAVALLAALGLVAAACSDDDGTAAPPPKTERDAYTQWYVQQALERYDDTGRQATIDYYNNEAGADDQWYVFIMDANTGFLVAHATIPSRVGTNSGERVDITGHAYGPLLRASPESGHWVDYVFYNPQTDTGGTKHTWAIRQDDLVFASGWYEDSYPIPRPTKSEPGSYTRTFVEDAVWFYESNGRDALIDHFNSPNSTDPSSVDGQWYGFVVDLNGVVLAHPTTPDYVGQTVHEILGDTPEGLAAADGMVAATETGTWVEYLSRNPQSGERETKHTWVVKRDEILIASGWYESG
ncbi:cache domain-containing protein [Candidatus Poriferisocius sp.]|uniref:cache domain-containing protein n=1 Tax=Candidatus Poriferisocius sp. TaxID=3101276 RepID=UPI003B52A2E3